MGELKVKDQTRGALGTVAAGALALAATLTLLGPATPARAASDGGFATLGPTSTPDQLFGIDTDPSAETLPIRRSQSSAPRVLYSIRLADSPQPSTVDVRAMTQTMFCRTTDIDGTNKEDGECRHSKPYRYAPRFFSKVVLSDSPTDTAGQSVIQDWQSVVCSDEVHHCPVPVQVDGAPVSGQGLYVNFVAAAQSKSAGKGQVLAVSFGDMQAIQSLAPPPQPPQTTDSDGLRSSFPMSQGSDRSQRADLRYAVLFSQPVDVHQGDVLDVTVRLKLAIHKSKDNAPLTAVFAYLTSDPDDAIPAGISTGQAAYQRGAQNCPGSCSFTGVGAIRSPDDGHMYLNVSAFSKDHEYRTKGTVAYDGTLSVTRR